MLVTYAPAGIEKLFERVFVPADDRTSPPPTEEMLARFAELEAEYGLETVWPGRPSNSQRADK
jgi:hypothetical protein